MGYGKRGKSSFITGDAALILSAIVRLQLFRSRLANLFSTTLQDDEQVFLHRLLELLNEGLATDQLFGTAEATAACQEMSDANELLLSDGVVYKI